MYKEHMQILDLHFRKFSRSIVGLGPHIDWTLEWHEVFLHLEQQHILLASPIYRVGPEFAVCVLKTGRSRCQISQLCFFFLAPFFCRISVLDCCTGPSPGNEMTVVLASLQATK